MDSNETTRRNSVHGPNSLPLLGSCFTSQNQNSATQHRQPHLSFLSHLSSSHLVGFRVVQVVLVAPHGGAVARRQAPKVAERLHELVRPVHVIVGLEEGKE